MGNEASLEGEGLPEGLAAAAGGAGDSGSALHPGIPAGMEADLSQLSEEERRQIAAVMSRAQGLPKGSVPAAAAESPSMHRHAQYDGDVQAYIYRFPCTKQELDSSQPPKQPGKPPDPGRPTQPGLSKSRTTDTFRSEQKLPGRSPSTISLKESKSRTDFKEEYKSSMMPGFFSDVNPLSAVSSVVNKFNPFDLISDSEASQEETTRKQKVVQKDQGKPEGVTKPPLQQPSPKSVPKQGPAKEVIQQDSSPKSASSQQPEKIKPQPPSTGKPSQASSQPPPTDQAKLPIQRDAARPQTKPSDTGKPSQQSPAKTPAQQASPGKSGAQQPGPAKATVQQPGPAKSPAQSAGTGRPLAQPPVTSKPPAQQAGVEKTSSQQPGPKSLTQTPGLGKIPPGPVKSPAQQPGTAKLPAQQPGPQPPAKVPGPTKTPAQQSGPGKIPAQQPGPAKPSPQQPIPTKPQPQQPAPTKPPHQQPTPAKPQPQQPTPAKSQPQQPTPAKPQPQQPAPAKPQPQQSTPAKPQPQQPSQAKPQPQQPSQAKPQAQQPAPVKPSAQQPMKATSQTVTGRPLQPPPTSAAESPGQGPSKTICPLCNTTELLLHIPEKANFNTCTECQTTVCSLCGFNPNPHLTEVSAFIKVQDWTVIHLELRFVQGHSDDAICYFQIKEWLCLNCQMQRALGGELAPIPSSPQPSPKAASVPPAAAASKPPGPPQPASPKKEPPPKQDTPKAPEQKKPPPLVKQPTLHGPAPATAPKPPVAEVLPEPAPPKEPSATPPEQAKAPVADVKPKQPKMAEPRTDTQSSAAAATKPDILSSQAQSEAQAQTALPLKTDSAKPSQSFPPTEEKITPFDSKAMPRPASDSKIISHPGPNSESKDPKHVDPTQKKEEPKKAQTKMSPKPDAKPVPKGSPTPSGPRPPTGQAAPPPQQPPKPQEQSRRFSLNLGSITDAPKSQPMTPQETVTGKLFGFGASIFSQASNLISTAGQPGPHPQTGPVAPTKQAPTPSQTPAAQGPPKSTGQLPPAPAKAMSVKETKAPAAESLESKTEQAVKRIEKDKKAPAGKVSKPPAAEPEKAMLTHKLDKTQPKPTCPLCKTELNIGSQDPPNFNTCTECKSQVCNLCGFNPTPHLTEEVVSCANASRVLHTFSSISFSVTGFMLRSLIHLDLSFVHGNRYGSICNLLHVDIQIALRIQQFSEPEIHFSLALTEVA
ncbi:hypothetical protein STEG23_038311, partial [Scotinomys teguina]